MKKNKIKKLRDNIVENFSDLIPYPEQIGSWDLDLIKERVKIGVKKRDRGDKPYLFGYFLAKDTNMIHRFTVSGHLNENQMVAFILCAEYFRCTMENAKLIIKHYSEH